MYTCTSDSGGAYTAAITTLDDASVATSYQSVATGRVGALVCYAVPDGQNVAYKCFGSHPVSTDLNPDVSTDLNPDVSTDLTVYDGTRDGNSLSVDGVDGGRFELTWSDSA